MEDTISRKSPRFDQQKRDSTMPGAKEDRTAPSKELPALTGNKRKKQRSRKNTAEENILCDLQELADDKDEREGRVEDFSSEMMSESEGNLTDSDSVDSDGYTKDERLYLDSEEHEDLLRHEGPTQRELREEHEMETRNSEAAERRAMSLRDNTLRQIENNIRLRELEAIYKQEMETTAEEERLLELDFVIRYHMDE
jgi:hypothetical protein